MASNNSEYGRNHKWIKAESGNTYLCHIDALNGLDNPTEADLQRVCLDESHNPQNS